MAVSKISVHLFVVAAAAGTAKNPSVSFEKRWQWHRECLRQLWGFSDGFFGGNSGTVSATVSVGSESKTVGWKTLSTDSKSWTSTISADKYWMSVSGIGHVVSSAPISTFDTSTFRIVGSGRGFASTFFFFRIGTELKWSCAGRGIGTEPVLRKQEVVWKNKIKYFKSLFHLFPLKTKY